MAASVRAFAEDAAEGVGVQGFLHTPEGRPGDGLVLTHGAGAHCETALLVALAEAFCAAGWMVLRANLPFRQVRPVGPPPKGSAEQDQQGLRAALASLRRLTPGRVLLGGHSYGGRQASLLAAAEPGLVEAMLLLSYPLHPPRKPADLRTAHFPELRTPALFVHGARDPFGSLEEMTAALPLLAARTGLLPVPAAGHELLSRTNAATMPAEVARKFAAFAAENAG